eukprot:scaffold18711_cov119-Isochrysis_galbana.AAC.10
MGSIHGAESLAFNSHRTIFLYRTDRAGAGLHLAILPGREPCLHSRTPPAACKLTSRISHRGHSSAPPIRARPEAPRLLRPPLPHRVVRLRPLALPGAVPFCAPARRRLQRLLLLPRGGRGMLSRLPRRLEGIQQSARLQTECRAASRRLACCSPRVAVPRLHFGYLIPCPVQK